MPRYATVKYFHETSSVAEGKRSVMLYASILRPWGCGIEDLCTRIDCFANFANCSLLGYSIYLLSTADEQQFRYNITYSVGKKICIRINGFKSCLVNPPCTENSFSHLTDLWCLSTLQNVLTGSMTASSTRDTPEAHFTIPSVMTNLPTNEQQMLMLHGIRSEVQDIPTLFVTHQLIKEIFGKIQTHYETESSKEFQLHPSCRTQYQKRLAYLHSLYGCWHLSLRLFDWQGSCKRTTEEEDL